MKLHELITTFEEYYPKHLAYDWDNVGLQIGSRNLEVSKVMITLDVTQDVVLEAIERNANVIIAHHPLIFRGIKNINTDEALGRIIELLIKHKISLYIAHTNFDISNFGLNKFLADELELQNQEILDYTTEFEGLGRVGDLLVKTPIKEFIYSIKELFDLESVKLVGNTKEVQKIAICGGSGSDLIHAAKQKKADIYISGDITYHHALDARAMGLTVLDVGHHIESFTMTSLQLFLNEKVTGVEFVVSKTNTNPYKQY